VDPYYLTYKSKELGYDSQVILAGRAINDGMAGYVAKKVLQHIIQHNSNIKDARVLVMGATFKENVSDIRNSKVADVVKELQSFSLNVDVVDPHADSKELEHEYGFGLATLLYDQYDAIIVTVPHEEYKNLNDEYFASISTDQAMVADLKGIYRGKIQSRKYWSL
jgi:UDP-N-acetyl-D-galactosamine dehydrogenase